MVVLGYIQNDVRRFKLFVANRVKKIRDVTNKEQWRYIHSNDNPAHATTKGISLKDTNKVRKWLDGPDFLHQQESMWIEEEIVPLAEDDPEFKVEIHVNTSKVNTLTPTIIDVLESRVSDWERWKRIMAFGLKFLKKCKGTPVCLELSIEELQEAEHALVKLIQEKYLSKHIVKVRDNSIPESKAVAKLNPFIDESGLLRVGGRLQHCSISRLRHPLILPKKSTSTDVIIWYYHRKVKHMGRTTTTNEIRANGYWILNITSRVSKIINNCFRCRRYRGKLGEQLMSQIPKSRTEMEAPFTYCGVDIFGPLTVKDGRKELKKYGALFTCFSCRAIHLEIVDKLDTSSFILALRRFLGRRGPVRSIRSDNGTNFVGAENQYVEAFKSMDIEQVRNFLHTKDCDWDSPVWEKNPPVSSHMGGVWERMIRSVRNTLRALLDEHGCRINSEALQTLIIEVEAIVNSRPIAVDTLNDPDIIPLTPNHLLTLKTKVVMPPPGEFQKEDLYCQKRWRSIQFLANEFWKRWSKEYLTSLQKRQKWTLKTRNFSINDVVLVKEQNLVRNKWLIGRITDVIPSNDGLVRTVKVRLAKTNSELTRSITKLVLLIGDEEQ